MKSLIKTVSVFTLAAFLFLVPDLQAATWTGDDLSNGGALTQDTTLTLSGGETVTVVQKITGSNASLTITGAGTLALDRDPDAASVYHTYTGPTDISFLLHSDIPLRSISTVNIILFMIRNIIKIQASVF